MPFQNRKHRSAFTLVELMVVLVILAMLSGVVTVSIRTYLLRSKQSVAKIEISKMAQATDTYFATLDRYPSNAEGLAILAAKTDDFPEGILTFVPNDPWGNPYEYRSPGVENEYEIISFGADKREGGTGANKDVTSMELTRAKKTSP